MPVKIVTYENLAKILSKINALLNGKASANHTHEEYLTEHQDISGKADVNHNHDSEYAELEHTHSQYLTEHQDISGLATKGELTNGLNSKADTEHEHEEYLTEHQDISGLATKSELSTKQSNLISGTNIKTINNQSLLGSGNIQILTTEQITALNNLFKIIAYKEDAQEEYLAFKTAFNILD